MLCYMAFSLDWLLAVIIAIIHIPEHDIIVICSEQIKCLNTLRNKVSHSAPVQAHEGFHISTSTPNQISIPAPFKLGTLVFKRNMMLILNMTNW